MDTIINLVDLLNRVGNAQRSRMADYFTPTTSCRRRALLGDRLEGIGVRLDRMSPSQLLNLARMTGFRAGHDVPDRLELVLA